MKHVKFSGPGKFVAGLIVGAVLFSGSAVAVNRYISDNSPEGGYLLCANKKTKAVTFPNKLTCPAGTVALDLGAVSGVEGPEGPRGPQGPAGAANSGSTGKLYFGVTKTPIDIVADGNISSSKNMISKIIYTIDSNEVPSGYYKLTAHVGALWGDTASSGSYAECYFQSDSDYVAKKGSRRYGAAMIIKSTWNAFDLTAAGDWFSSLNKKMHLICKTSGTLKDIRAKVEAVSAVNEGVFAGVAK